MESFTGFWADAASLFRQFAAIISVQIVGNWPVSLGVFVLGLVEPKFNRCRPVR